MINQETFPEILIERVELSLGQDLQRRNDPHTKEDTTINFQKDRFFNNDFSQIPTFSKKENVLNITVEMRFEDDLYSLLDDFLSDEEIYQKYLKLKVAVVDDKETYLDILKFNKLMTPREFDRMSAKGKIKIQDQPITDLILELGEGEEVEQNIIRKTFKTNNLNPDFLSIIVFSYFDIDQLEQDFGVDLEASPYGRSSSRFIVENIINNSEVVAQTFVFRNKEGNIYSAPVKIQNNEYIAIDTEEKLEVERVDNNVVFDYRPIEMAQDTSLFFETIKDKFNDIFTLSNGDVIKSAPDQSIGDIFMSRDNEGQSRFSFHISVKNILKNYGIFGFLLEGDSSDRFLEIALDSPIKQIRVSRKRVRRAEYYNSLGAPASRLEDFYPTDESLVALGGESRTKAFQDFSGDKAGLRELDIQNYDVRFFTGRDGRISKKTDGLYSYEVEIEITDGTRKYIENKIADVGRIISSLEQYKNLALYPEHNKRGKFTPEFSEFARNRYKQEMPWIFVPSKFISILSNLYNFEEVSLFDTMQKSIVPELGSVDGIDLFLDLVGKVETDLENLLKRSNIGTSNRTKSHPAATSVKRGYVKENNIIIRKSFNKAFDSNKNKKVGLDFIRFKGDDSKVVNFIDTTGLNTISISNFIERAGKETDKYFQDPNTTVDLTSKGDSFGKYSVRDNSYAYFTPSMVYTNRSGEHDLIKDSKDSKKSIKIKTDLLLDYRGIQKEGTKGTKDKSELSKDDNDISNNLKSLYSNIRVKSKKKSGQNLVEASNTIKNDKIATSNKSEDSDKVQKTLSGKSVFMNSLSRKNVDERDKKYKFRNFKDNNYFNLDSSKNILRKSNLTLNNIKDIPNQIKSLFTENGSSRNFNDLISFEFNYELIYKVEYLKSFKVSSNFDVLINDSEWEMLTPDVIRGYRDKEILCRLRRYDNDLVNVGGVDSEIDENVFNEYFIIRLDKELPPKEIKTLDRRFSEYLESRDAKKKYGKETNSAVLKVND